VNQDLFNKRQAFKFASVFILSLVRLDNQNQQQQQQDEIFNLFSEYK
jgi:hypothetical protein